jgi:hypothetical protein
MKKEGVDRLAWDAEFPNRPSACVYSAHLLNISPQEDRCFFLRCYRNPV